MDNIEIKNDGKVEVIFLAGTKILVLDINVIYGYIGNDARR